jgi:hypothetical protein
MRWLLKRKQGSVRICKAIKLAIYLTLSPSQKSWIYNLRYVIINFA